MANVNIQINVSDASLRDPMVQAVLAALTGNPTHVSISEPHQAVETVTTEPVAAAEPKKVAPKRAKKSAPAKVEEPTPEPEEDDSEDAADEATMDDAIAAATAMIGKGKQAEVKAALKELGARRVSELKGDKISAFVKDLTND